MTNVRVDFGRSVDNFIDLTHSTSQKVKKEVNKILRRTVNEILRDVRRHTPSRSGRLRAGWRIVKKNAKIGNRYTIFNDVPYAAYVEHGTRYMAARRMLEGALRRGEARLMQRLSKLRDKVAREFN